MDHSQLPRWDMTTIFPSLHSPEFISEFEAVCRDIQELAHLFDSRGVRRRISPGIDEQFLGAFEECIQKLNALLERVKTLGSYISCFVTTDARDDLARTRESELDNRTVLLDQLYTRFIAWVGTSDIDDLLAMSQSARDHKFILRKAQTQAARQMPEGEEELAAELKPVGLGSWALLHGNLTALLTARVAVRGKDEELPLSSIRALASNPERAVRKAAYESEIRALESVSLPIAAALNSIKGYQRTIRSRRGWEDDIEPTLLANSIDRATLDAMQASCIESFPDFHRYLDAKARALGVPNLAWYDLLAPLGDGGRKWTWVEAEEFIRRQFRSYSSRLADFADRTFNESWIDAGPRLGKEGGAYCAGIRPGESRVMMNFDFAFDSVSTLAHELGHAYHNLNLRDRSALQRGTPATLAETASIFCETIAFEAALAGAKRPERLALLDSTLQRDLLVVVDIHSRFLFEKIVFQRRAQRDLTVTELNELMTDAQRQTYGPDLDPLHPYMWAVKGHYYGPTFYNYPYTFGLLFGLGIYANYQSDPEGFKAEYDEFLSSTGMTDAADLGSRFGADVTGIDFWRSSLDVIRGHVTEFEDLVQQT